MEKEEIKSKFQEGVRTIFRCFGRGLGIILSEIKCGIDEGLDSKSKKKKNKNDNTQTSEREVKNE